MDLSTMPLGDRTPVNRAVPFGRHRAATGSTDGTTHIAQLFEPPLVGRTSTTGPATKLPTRALSQQVHRVRSNGPPGRTPTPIHNHAFTAIIRSTATCCRAVRP